MSSAHNFIPLGRCEYIKQWISYRKYHIIFAASNFIVIISILSVFMHHHDGFQDQLKEMKVDIERLNTSLSRARQSLLENDSELEAETMVLATQIKALESDRISKLEESIKKNAFHSRAAAARSCQELYDHGFRQDGYYWIDPDGRYIGNVAFEVYCKNMGNSHTIHSVVPTVSKTKFEVYAKGKGDFKFPVEYKPSMEQLVGLVQNSGFCEQTIGKVLIELSDCNDFHVYP